VSKGANVRESACEEEYGKEPVPESGTACAKTLPERVKVKNS